MREKTKLIIAWLCLAGAIIIIGWSIYKIVLIHRFIMSL